MGFIKNIFNNETIKNGQWNERKFRRKFLFRLATNPISTIKHFNSLISLNDFDKIINIQPNLPAKIHRPYLHKFGGARKRSVDIVSHYTFVQELPKELRNIFYSKDPVCISKFLGKNNEELSIYCSTSRFDREGESMLTLYFNGVISSQATFSFIKKDGGNVIFIGALQGANKNTEHSIIQQATKASYGLFPKRIIMESLCAISMLCSVDGIFAVTERSHVFKHYLYKNKKNGKFLSIYREFWDSIGGVPVGDFYKLPKIIERKNLDDIPSKKRSEYRRRYVLLDQINHDITALLIKKKSDLP